MKFVIYDDEAGEWRWRLVADNGETVADGAEGYASRANAQRAVETVTAGLSATDYTVVIDATASANRCPTSCSHSTHTMFRAKEKA